HTRTRRLSSHGVPPPRKAARRAPGGVNGSFGSSRAQGVRWDARPPRRTPPWFASTRQAEPPVVAFPRVWKAACARAPISWLRRTPTNSALAEPRLRRASKDAPEATIRRARRESRGRVPRHLRWMSMTATARGGQQSRGSVNVPPAATPPAQCTLRGQADAEPHGFRTPNRSAHLLQTAFG